MQSSSSSQRALGKQRSLHEIFGSGIVADVILWRRRDITMGILLGTLAAWVVFEVSGYTLLSLVSNVLLLLISVLFLWAKAAAVLNRPPPPIPEMYLSQELMNEAAELLRHHINMALSAFHNIALGKDLKFFFRKAVCLWLISFIGGFTNLLTLGYTSLVIILTIPAFYQMYEDHFDQYMKLAYTELKMYERVYTQFFNKYFYKGQRWLIDKKKLL